MIHDRTEHLEFLKNEAVNAVTFMHQCLQIDLTQATLTCYPGPVILAAAADYTLTDADYKNQLCQLLNQRVKAITETNRGLVLTFTDQELLFQKDGPREVLVITDGNGDWHSYPQLLEGL